MIDPQTPIPGIHLVSIDALPSMLGEQQVAFILNISRAQVRAHWKKKVLPGRLIGRRLYIQTQAVRCAYQALRAVQAEAA